jgi:hypothetical protein
VDRNIVAQRVALALFGLIFLASGIWIVLMAANVFIDAIALVAWPVMLFSLWRRLREDREAASP